METIVVYCRYTRIMEKIMERKVETTVVYGGYTGIMERNMEATVVYWLPGRGKHV